MGRREFTKEKYEGNNVIRIDHTYGSPSTYFEYEDEYHLLEELQQYRDLEEQGRLIEVVRCKECWRYDTGAGYDGWGLCELYDQDRKDNDYCSFGELKELEGDKEWQIKQ